MNAQLYIATRDGVAAAERNGRDWRLTGRSLEGREITSIITREGVILAGTRQGVLRSDDGGRSWTTASDGLSQPYVRWLAYHPDISDVELAGTEPASIFVSADGGDSWSARPEVAELRDRFGWWLPYSPGAGCVRGFAFHGRRAYAAVEVGGLLRS
ncbi:MAG: WD40/YVTN/BNR-like repeat-containing protein, partial [Candidatus Promineifilaceae bacterium]